MKKKIVFSCLSILFLLSSISGLLNGNAGGAVGCLVLAALFAFLLYRSSIHADPVTPPKNSDNLASSGLNNPAPVTSQNISFEFVKIKVAGVTFKNEKGMSRQTLLRKIKFHDNPFDEYIELELRPYEYEGSAAYGVYANSFQIGNIPADKVQFISDNLQRLDCISAINVYGGGRNSEGYAISYGCEITLKFHIK